jgi:hypothetical protein
VSSGLSIFGDCLNSKCKAFNNEVVHKRYFKDFELSYHKDEIKCPMCCEKIKPKSCGFYNCEWSYSAIIIENLQPKILVGEWKEVKKIFTYFDSNDKSSDYIQLKIRVRQITDEICCDLCHILIKSDVKSCDCKKNYHDECLNNWKKNGNEKCPECVIDKLNNFCELVKIEDKNVFFKSE